MAMLLETEGHKDNPSERVDLVDHNSSDYDQFLSDAEATETGAINYEIPPPPLRVRVTMHLDGKHNALTKTHNQKRNVSRHIAIERRYNLATPLTIPTVTYTTSSTSSVMHT